MQILLIHSDFMEYWITSEIRGLKTRDEIDGINMKQHARFEECLVAFIAAEHGDAEKGASSVAAEQIKEVVNQINAPRVILYPYAHLSPNLARPLEAISLLDELQSRLNAEGIESHRVPFGWYKKFNIQCKGHPLSELSKRI